MFVEHQKAGNTLSIADRRARERLHSPSLIFLNRDHSNGGVVFNITEDGMALSAAKPIFDEHSIDLRVQFPGSKDWMEFGGQIVWKSKSNREIGVRFADLSNEALLRIRRELVVTEINNTLRAPNGEAARLDPGSSPDQPVKTVAKPAAAQTGKSATYLPAGTSWPASDRRSHPRVAIVPLGYLRLGESNGGIAFNISQGGLAITAAAVLRHDYLPRVTLQIPDTSGWIEASGEIAWRSPSKKEAGVRFVDLTEEAQRRIADWISAQTSSHAVQDKIVRIPEERDSRTETPIVLEPLNSAPTTAMAAAEIHKPEVASSFSPGKESRSRKAGARAAVPRAVSPARRPRVRRDIPLPAKLTLLQSKAPARHPARRLFAGLIIFLGALLIGREWILPRAAVRNEMTAAVTEKNNVGSKASNRAAFPPLNTSASAPSARAVVVKENPQPGKEPLPAREESVHARSRDNAQQVQAVTRAFAKPALKARSRTDKKFSAQEKPGRESWRIAAGLHYRPFEKAPRTINTAPPIPLQLETPIAQPINLSPASLKDIQPPAPKEKESSTVSAKPPAIPANTIGEVAIVADPYPSLLMPEGRSSKKQRKQTSLQLGHLLSRVEPVYPEEAKQQRIQGTVKLHAIIGRHGAVEQLQSVNGSPVLVVAAMSAVRRWRYSETLLAGRSVKTEEDISVIFRLSPPPGPKK